MPPYIFFHGAASLAPWSELEQGHICMATCIFYQHADVIATRGCFVRATRGSRQGRLRMQAQARSSTQVTCWAREDDYMACEACYHSLQVIT